MWLSDVSVKRPVFATVVNLILLIFGIVCFTMLPLREFPDIDAPIVTISTDYPGASAEIVETKITQPIEDMISGVEGIKNINSNSRDGRSNVTIEFNISRDIDAAANDVRERVSRILDNLPDQAYPPEVFKADGDDDTIAWFVLNSETMTNLELSDYADRYIVERFSVVDGVARIQIGGERRYAMRLWLDKDAMAARGVTVQDIETVLRAENVELPAGNIKSEDRNFTVRVVRTYKTQQDFRRLAIKRGEDNYLVRLGEVAQVILSSEDEENEFRGDGKNLLGIGIIKQSKANTLDVVQNARAEMEKIKAALPAGTTIEPGYDSSLFIAESIKEVYNTLGIAMGMVVLVIFLFLGNLRATFIPAITVPVALVAAVTVLYALDFSINLLTLLAMVLAIGLVVDDSIVVLENIYRRIEEGEHPLLASYRGAREVGFAVVATTLVLIAVFVPLVFMQGELGKLFTEFALAVAAAVAFSAITALTLSPMLASKLLTHKKRESRFSAAMHKGFAKLEELYSHQLNAVIVRRWPTMAVLVMSFVATVLLLKLIPSELAPQEDRGTFFVNMSGAEGASYANNSRNMRLIEDLLMPYYEKGEFNRLLIRVPGWGNSGGVAIVGTENWNNGKRRTSELMQEVSGKLNELPDVKAFTFMRSGLGGGRGGGRPVQFVIQGNTYQELVQWRDIVLAKAAQNPNLQMLDHDYKETVPQVLVEINSERAADLGVSVGAVGQALEAMLGGRRVTTFLDRGKEYDVILEGEDKDFAKPGSISNVYVRAKESGQLIPLDNLVVLKEEATTSSLNRYNRMRSITITANLAPGYSLGEALEFLEKTVKDNIEGTVGIDYKGESLLFKESGESTVLIFALALLITFLVLAAQFESFIHPFVIMLTVPLGLVGALAGLYLAGMTLNIYSQIGLVMLIGLVAKNGILIVEFANQLRDAGVEFEQAIKRASALRLRPIVMTAFTTVFSAIPLIITTGPGSESRMVIGMVIFAGVGVATLLTIYVVPVAYMVLARNTGSPLAISKELELLDKEAADKAPEH
ncbi:efflux RND transporter permease subunit [Rheinheimera mesophila]|uniref:Efflux RND transporter permease subunit n=1 Tax=Rheinheimera mesophila TaxID=1547515 RepID=A0A3P3QF81_9GAMM|nr:efflux RND transporter permease subunit [Rheinheimera mesophila]KKL00718.1 multidrug transporter AcrB [Rheinheimera mesophila]RRJ19781.1 efflux RND transporter permease subunit [Rheinheimera mesophila]